MTLLAQIVILAPLAHPPPAQDRQVAARVARVLQALAQHARFVHVLHRRARSLGAAGSSAHDDGRRDRRFAVLRASSPGRAVVWRAVARSTLGGRGAGAISPNDGFSTVAAGGFSTTSRLFVSRGAKGARHSATTDAATDRARDGSGAGEIK